MMTEGDNIEHYIVNINNSNVIEFNLIEFKEKEKIKNKMNVKKIMNF